MRSSYQMYLHNPKCIFFFVFCLFMRICFDRLTRAVSEYRARVWLVTHGHGLAGILSCHELHLHCNVPHRTLTATEVDSLRVNVQQVPEGERERNRLNDAPFSIRPAMLYERPVDDVNFEVQSYYVDSHLKFAKTMEPILLFSVHLFHFTS